MASIFSRLDWHHHDSIPSLQGSVQELSRLVKDPTTDLKFEELPHLDRLVGDWFDDRVHVSEEQFARRILTIFQSSSHNNIYDQVLSKLPSQQQNLVNAFVAEKITAEDAGRALTEQEEAEHAAALEAPEQEEERPFIRDQASDPQSENWGGTVKQTPAITYYPENTKEIQTIVREAVKNNRGIRVAGSRHSWAPVFGRNGKPGSKNNGDVLISTLTQRNAADLPNFTGLPSSLFQPKASELNDISIVDAAYVNGPVLSHGKKYVRVGTATTSEQFRRWAIKEGKVAMPMDVILTEVTLGGTNAPICHGAGLRHATLSDLVRCIEYVDVNAQVRVLNMADPDLMKAAGGCFGLLGVVTHITLECDAMSTAVMRPMKLEVIDAIPPPPDMHDEDIPKPLRKFRTPRQKHAAQQAFEQRANNDYYAEWFWFPDSNKVWVNTWNTDVSTADVVNYPSYVKTFLQVLGTVIMSVAQNLLADIDALQAQPYLQTTFLSWLALKNFDDRTDDQAPIRALLPDALHFQRGVHNIRVRDLEVELPLHAKKGTTSERDYSNVQRAWWDAIITAYANVKTCPQRMPLEMRITGPSEVTMAPQRTQKLGTCAIEILTLKVVSDESIWNPYAQQVLDRWTSYKDGRGRPLVVRPHWAKEWAQFQVEGKPWRDRLRDVDYKDEIAEFRTLMAAIGKKHGWTLEDIQRTFSNDFLDYLYFGDVAATTDEPRGKPRPVAATEKANQSHSYRIWPTRIQKFIVAVRRRIEGVANSSTGTKT